MNLDALKELAEKVEAGTYDNVTAFRAFEGKHQNLIGDAFGGSLDAAKALHEAVLPDYTLSSLCQQRHPDHGQPPNGKWLCLLFGIVEGNYRHAEGKHTCPARAWLLAILRALIATQEQTHD